jgi:hypothetical protein
MEMKKVIGISGDFYSHKKEIWIYGILPVAKFSLNPPRLGSTLLTNRRSVSARFVLWEGRKMRRSRIFLPSLNNP